MTVHSKNEFLEIKRYELPKFLIPFLGTKENYDVFEYLLHQLSELVAIIFIPPWLVEKTVLNVGENVHLHFPSLIEQGLPSTGKIASIKWDESLNTNVLRIALFEIETTDSITALKIKKNEINHLNTLSNDDKKSTFDEFTMIIKDCYFLKKGIGVYYKHLIPYFSRISGIKRKHYPHLKKTILDDIQKRIQQHMTSLQFFYYSLRASAKENYDLSKSINLDQIREWIISEISSDMMNILFENKLHQPYINAIKNLENKLYLNYNNLVLNYIQSIKND